MRKITIQMAAVSGVNGYTRLQQHTAHGVTITRKHFHWHTPFAVNAIGVGKFQQAGCIVGVNNASFEVHQGELLIIMGLSGSGKSTLLRCISRLTDATAGNIYIEGEDILSMNSKQLIELRRNKMGMVFQSFALLPHKTVLENIAFPLQVKGVNTDDSIKRAKEMVDLVS